MGEKARLRLISRQMIYLMPPKISRQMIYPMLEGFQLIVDKG
jgi:hypothetical protein